MKVLYFDCASGISGNMTLGALLEIAGNKEYLLEQLATLKIEGYKIEITKKIKNGITGTYVDVILEKENLQSHHIQEHHYHMHRNLKDIYTIIENSQIETKSKELAKRIFLRVAKAESKVHNKPIEEVHFHEVGAIDSIIDIVGTAILINQIHPDKIISSVVNDGYGFIECAHGKMSVPVPATSEIFASSGVKFRQIQIDTELVTPTGAAIIAEPATQFTWLPTMKVEKIGWGVGSKELNIPNVLKIYSGEIEEVGEEEVVVLLANIDDCTGEILGYTSELLFQKGALDVLHTYLYEKETAYT
ncbi:MAG: nickel pincer cofactor biosynthesis protein LarC [Clostridia bacterium]